MRARDFHAQFTTTVFYLHRQFDDGDFFSIIYDDIAEEKHLAINTDTFLVAELMLSVARIILSRKRELSKREETCFHKRQEVLSVSGDYVRGAHVRQ